ncbi:right-handed parallel beta-helix repeat-containing protein [Alterisphingorhabdus coralli]|uniref:Right-handed parallel beta-helix repeat-containing protein n=1 Tax=Alterisphingorhabdus coralli TaxID=3071408 RepID=A0AA97FA04_9SPHN|nr:right-handed parallel beta-helix repeat-containing protein [Parasphingorhabdus sp. SCSIO 66989]WOE75792.1 right-handed parallel beta-helix repeat-containing protein [Parasphingorhabdus sp. SCSIO 66989]
MASASLRAPSFLSLAAASALALGLPSGGSAQAQQGAGYTIVETGQRFSSLQQAVDTIGNARGTIEVAPGTYRDCAVQNGGYVVFKAQQPGSAVFDGGICENKATLVVRGQGTEVRGLVFQNLNVPDLNGSGIRHERGNVTVVNSWFRNSQQGILTANDPSGSLTIDKSTFSGLGRCGGGKGCAHSVYTGLLGSLTVTRSRFEQGRGGHYVKTRVLQVQISGNSFDDTKGITTNYMVDLSAGSVGQISNNIFVQGRNKENYSAFIAVAPEGQDNPTRGLTITGNDARIAPGVNRNTWFVADWRGEPLNIAGNTLGKGISKYQKR